MPPDSSIVHACLSHVISTESQQSNLKWHFSSDFESRFVTGDASCAAIRTRISVATTADFHDLVRTLDALSGEQVEVSWHGDEQLFWIEFNISLLHDVTFVAVSFGALLAFMIAVLRLPAFATCSLLIVAMSLPVGFALYTGPLEQEKLPILAIVSIYLILGIGADAVFVFTNTYALEEAEARRQATSQSAPPTLCTPSPESSLPATPATSGITGRGATHHDDVPPSPSAGDVGEGARAQAVHATIPAVRTTGRPFTMGMFTMPIHAHAHALGSVSHDANKRGRFQPESMHRMKVLARTLQHSTSGALVGSSNLMLSHHAFA